jgi:glycosyltransferase involved in cell wall biosynthesis
MTTLVNGELANSGKRRVLIVHNVYRQHGGEDGVVAAERSLLQSHGHAVELFRRHNDELLQISRWRAALDTVWSSSSSRALAETIQRFCPDVVHFHNTFPLISPAAYWVVRAAGLPVVQTLHNFRLHCPQACYLRAGRVCEDCLGHLPWRSVLHGCYRASRTQSAVSCGMLTLHRWLGSYRDKVTRYIALSEFCRDKFIAGGLPAGRIAVKPNFVDWPAPLSRLRQGFLFVGRLAPEKGVALLVDAWKRQPGGSLRVVGSGPLSGLLDQVTGLSAMGALSAEEVRLQMEQSLALILPSIWYENFPLTLVEAFASGLPVIASRLGSLAELLQDQVTGLLFDPGDVADLARKIQWAALHPQQMALMGRNARARYQAEFCAERNYAQLTAIYEEAIAEVSAETHYAPLNARRRACQD